MKKSVIVLGAVAVVLLMVSTVTAMPQVQSEPVLKKINKAEETQAMLEGKLETLIEKARPKTIIGTIFGVITLPFALVFFGILSIVFIVASFLVGLFGCVILGPWLALLDLWDVAFDLMVFLFDAAGACWLIIANWVFFWSLAV